VWNLKAEAEVSKDCTGMSARLIGCNQDNAAKVQSRQGWMNSKGGLGSLERSRLTAVSQRMEALLGGSENTARRGLKKAG